MRNSILFLIFFHVSNQAVFEDGNLTVPRTAPGWRYVGANVSQRNCSLFVRRLRRKIQLGTSGSLTVRFKLNFDPLILNN